MSGLEEKELFLKMSNPLLVPQLKTVNQWSIYGELIGHLTQEKVKE